MFEELGVRGRAAGAVLSDKEGVSSAPDLQSSLALLSSLKYLQVLSLLSSPDLQKVSSSRSSVLWTWCHLAGRLV